MKTKIKTITLLAIIALGFLLAGCQQQEKTTKDDTLKIGFVGPLSGPLSNPGVYIKNSFSLAHNQNDTVNGKKIDVIYEDGRCNPRKAVTSAKKLLNVNDADILVSSMCGGSTMAISELIKDKDTILISSVASTPAISNAGKNVFRISSSADLFAERTASKIENLNYDKIGIVVENTKYTIGWKNSFKEVYNGTITRVEKFNTGDTSMKSQLTKIKSTNPDAVLFLVQSPKSGALLVKQSKELGIESQLIGNEAFFVRQLFKNMGNSSDGFLILTYKYSHDSEKMKNLLDDYKKKYGKELPEDLYGALGYDTYNLLHDALKKCNGSDTDCIKEYLSDVEDREGASGEFSINNKGDGIREFMWWKVDNGKIVPYEN